jgi:regulatory protein
LRKPHKELTRAEARDWLARRGEADVEGALAELDAAGLIDDERYARQFAADKRELAGWGDERIAATLRRRGVDDELVEAALAEEGEGGELERAVAVLARRGERPGDDAERGRCVAALARRGFAEEVAYEAVRRFERASL